MGFFDGIKGLFGKAPQQDTDQLSRTGDMQDEKDVQPTNTEPPAEQDETPTDNDPGDLGGSDNGSSEW